MRVCVCIYQRASRSIIYLHRLRRRPIRRRRRDDRRRWRLITHEGIPLHTAILVSDATVTSTMTRFATSRLLDDGARFGVGGGRGARIGATATAGGSSPSPSILALVVGALPSASDTQAAVPRAVVVAVAVAPETLEHVRRAIRDVFGLRRVVLGDGGDDFSRVTGRARGVGVSRVRVALGEVGDVRDLLTGCDPDLMAILEPCAPSAVALVSGLGRGGT